MSIPRTAAELEARKAAFRARWSERLGRPVDEEEAAEIRRTWCRYLSAVAPVLHETEDGPRSVPARRKA